MNLKIENNLNFFKGEANTIVTNKGIDKRYKLKNVNIKLRKLNSILS